jgi:hypothetical protein
MCELGYAFGCKLAGDVCMCELVGYVCMCELSNLLDMYACVNLVICWICMHGELVNLVDLYKRYGL